MLTTSKSTKNRENSGKAYNTISYQVSKHEHPGPHLIAHGPYCNLHSGNYRVRVELEDAKILRTQIQKDLSQKVDHQLCPDGSVTFKLNHYTTNIEILLYSTPGEAGTIKNISIIINIS